MDGNGLTAGDVLAMTNRDNGGFLEGNGIIILLLFLLFMGGGFGGFGNYGNNAAFQNGLTRAEMQDGFNNQNLVNSFNGLNSSLCSHFADLNLNINNGFNGLAMGINNGFNSVNSNLAQLGFNMQNCCCEIKQQVGLQGDLTRQLIQNNTIQDLRDKIADKDRELNASIFVNSQQIQTRTLEDFILANKTAPAVTA